MREIAQKAAIGGIAGALGTYSGLVAAYSGNFAFAGGVGNAVFGVTNRLLQGEAPSGRSIATDLAVGMVSGYLSGLLVPIPVGRPAYLWAWRPLSNWRVNSWNQLNRANLAAFYAVAGDLFGQMLRCKSGS